MILKNKKKDKSGKWKREREGGRGEKRGGGGGGKSKFNLRNVRVCDSGIDIYRKFITRSLT